MKYFFTICILVFNLSAADGALFSEYNKKHSKIVRQLYPLSSEQTEKFAIYSKASRGAFVKLYRSAEKYDNQLKTLTDELQAVYDVIKKNGTNTEDHLRVNKLKTEIKIYLVDKAVNISEVHELYQNWTEAVMAEKEQFWTGEIKKHLGDKSREYKEVIKAMRASLIMNRLI